MNDGDRPRVAATDAAVRNAIPLHSGLLRFFPARSWRALAALQREIERDGDVPPPA